MSNRLEALGLRGVEIDQQIREAQAEQEEIDRNVSAKRAKDEEEQKALHEYIREYSGPIIHAHGLTHFRQPQAVIRGCGGKEEVRDIPPFIVSIPPWHHRLRDWLAVWPLAPWLRIKQALSWWVKLPFRGWEVVKVVFGGNVDAPHYRNRMQACLSCNERILDMPSGHSYCRPCGCPKWPLSRLAYKNRKVQWSCPMRRFEEGYPDDAIRLTLKGLEYVPGGHLDHHASGCGGCGGGASTNGQTHDPRAMAELNGSGPGG